MKVLAGEIGERHVHRPQALRDAAAYIESEWRRQGYDVVRQSYRTYGVRCDNLQVTRPGCVQPESIVLLGAHYDTVPGSPGANDNGSGVASLLEISRAFASASPRETVRFVAFVNEEAPFFTRRDMGSMVYAREARQRGDAIRLMVSLETMGYFSDRPGSQGYPPLFRWFYPDRANFIAFVTNLRHRRAMLPLVRAFRAGTTVPAEQVAMTTLVPGVGWSDHSSFWRHGYPAVMVTDTAFYRYLHYHGSTDTPDRLSYEVLARVTEGLVAATES